MIGKTVIPILFYRGENTVTVEEIIEKVKADDIDVPEDVPAEVVEEVSEVESEVAANNDLEIALREKDAEIERLNAEIDRVRAEERAMYKDKILKLLTLATTAEIKEEVADTEPEPAPESDETNEDEPLDIFEIIRKGE